ncbi:hypothetical protein FGB62_111g08 [Gracilaria domingensis]|nr:hypothetical protein FGB62_111g08 [Gracilaria domingensis]
MCLKIPSFFIILSFVLAVGQSHSHLANPLPTRRLDCRVGNGRPRACYGPCPALDTYGEPTGITPQRPAETWRRGERRFVSWHRNNHGQRESGFVRLTLVPVSKMMDKDAHKKFTFQISCWSSGLHRCPSRKERVCGNDGEGMAYKVPITVPSVYPDDVYAFGWAWYGGGDFRGKGYFGDYYSCSFVRIQGGRRVTRSYSPQFVAGIGQPSRSTCISSVDRLGVCVREPCSGPDIAPRKPAELPREIRLRDVIQGGIRGQAGDVSQASSGGRNKHRTPIQPSSGNDNEEEKAPSVKSFRIYDVKTRHFKSTRRRKIRVPLSKYENGFTIGLKVQGHVTKVTFSGRRYFHTEAVPPYIINGNLRHRLRALRCRKGRTQNYQATLFGVNGRRKDVNFNVKCV